MRELRRFGLLLSVSIALSACESTVARTEILVQVTADAEVRAALESLRVRVFGGSDAQLVLGFEHEEPSASLEWPVQLGIVPRDGEVDRRFRVEVAALDGARTIAIARVESAFIEGETRVLAVHLATACLEVACADAETCAGGTCVATPQVDPADLPRIGEELDGGSAGDSGASDSGASDAGAIDGARLDAGPGDGAPPDAPSTSDGGADACTPLEFFADMDGDGYGDANASTSACEMPAGHVANGMDCDDACEGCRPGAVEVCDGTRDEDCDGATDEGCECAAGASRPCPGAIDTGACETGSQTCAGGTWSFCVGRVDPATELCNGADDDCDGVADDGITRACGIDTGECASGIETCSNGTFTGCTAIEPASETCNGRDDDCDGTPDDGVLLTFHRDADGDGFGNALATMTACAPPSGWVSNATDCNDACATCRPGGTEICDGARDEDCDGTVDEMCACVDGTVRACPDGTSTGACEPGTQTCAGGTWGGCAGRVDPVTESCNNVDDDCDGQIDDALTRTCGPTTVTGICRRGVETCSAGGWSTCVGAVFPRPETCDGADEDCDGVVDEGVLQTFYRDGDNDGFGVSMQTVVGCTAPMGYASRGGDCDDVNPQFNPGVTEICDGLDQDCDGRADGMPDCSIPAGCVVRSFDRHLYAYCSQDTEWLRAPQICSAIIVPGGARFDLARITTPEENGFVGSLLTAPSAWIGLNDIMLEGTYRWSVDDSSTLFSPWGMGQPDDRDPMLPGSADCVRIGSDRTWSDAVCDGRAHFVCEQSP